MRLLKLVPDNTNFPFMRFRLPAMALSILVILGAMVLVGTRGLNYGVDFAGGLMMEVRVAEPVRVDEMRAVVNSAGAGSGTIQNFGDDRTVAIRLPLPPGDEAAVQRVVTRIQGIISDRYKGAEFRRVETVSGKVSGELVETGALAVLLAMLGIAIYIWFRFEWQFGVGALFSLAHDVAITMGFFSLTQLDFDLNIVAAVLTIVGYSLNDTIVVYDRVRENLRKYRKMGIIELLDLSLNETLPRTIVTSLTMIIALATLVVLGGEVMFGFAVAMLLGIIVGTYSSIFVAASILIWLKVKPDTFVPATTVGEKPVMTNERLPGKR
ncbi:MAG: protein translocase subunit SecF [Sandarakinorhabdus sp.]|jgi:preprotein translocase subunit SecF|nr:protein translocase subunit SecF [Sandarakinorhabdus sp.]